MLPEREVINKNKKRSPIMLFDINLTEFVQRNSGLNICFAIIKRAPRAGQKVLAGRSLATPDLTKILKQNKRS